MSYIYEALKRAQKENERSAVLPGGSVRRSVFFAGPTRSWVWVVIGILALNVIVLAAVVVRDRPSAPDVATGGAPPSAPAVVDTRVEPAPAPAAPAAPPAQAASPAPVAAVAARSTPAPTVPPARAAAAPPAPVRPSVEPPPARASRGAPAAPAASPARAIEPPSAPVVSPKVTLQVIVYSEDPSQRMVFIDGRRYVEGDAFDADTVLEQIMADGVVMKRGGQRFVISERRS